MKIKMKRTKGRPGFLERVSRSEVNYKEEMFCQAFIVDFNITNACKAAGYIVTNTNDKRAVPQLLQIPKIRARINELMRERLTRSKVTQDKIIAEVASIAFSNPKALFDGEGNFKGIHRLSDDEVKMLKGIKVKQKKTWTRGGRGKPPDEIDELVLGGEKENPAVGESEVIELQFYDKLSALELLGRHLGLFDHRFRVDVNENRKLSVEIQWNQALETLSLDELESLMKLMAKISDAGNIEALPMIPQGEHSFTYDANEEE